MKRIRIRNVSLWSMVVAIVVGILFLMISHWSNQEFRVLETSTDQYIACEQSAKELKDASNYLTEQVRLYAMTGQREYLDNYFREADETQRREQALEELQKYFDGTHTFSTLQTAMGYSKELMKTEYYSMRLVLEAKNIAMEKWPEAIREVEISELDERLSAVDKMERAQWMVCDTAYQTVRTQIDDQVAECVESLTEQTHNQQSRAEAIFSDMYRKLELGIVVLVAMMLIMCVIIRKLVVVPILKCNQSIEKGETFPVEGAEELQVMAETYNKVYKENEEAQQLIRHKAEHDALTDLLNRGSFDKLLKLYENGEAPFALIIVDVDSFKQVNDTYGHTIGDETLKRVAKLLKNTFRSIDYVCRIGGDEFAVIMVEMTSDLKYTIQKKIAYMNETLKIADGEVPATSLSVGVAFSDRENPHGTLFEDADQALYKVKTNGKSGCDFY